MKLRRLASLLLLAAAFATASCTTDILDDEWSGGTTTTLTIETELPELGGTTRADADNSAKGGVVNIDWSKYNLRIKARAYDTKDNTKYEEVIEYRESADDIGTITIPMSVTNGRMYDIYVWADIVLADNHSDLHYNTENLPTVTYTEGDGPAINDETYDAFFGYGRASTTRMGVTWDTTFSLQRAVSKLRIVAEDSDNSATSATVAIDGILYSGIKFGGNISYSGEMNATEDSGDIISYNRDTADATTMITAYLLTPEEANYTITATLYAGSSEINSISVPDVPLKRGHLTTLRGSMFSSGEAWDGSIEVPTQFDGEWGEWMVINTPGELLWLATAAEAPTVNGTTYSKFRLGKDIDMVGTTIESLRIGNDATFDGNGKTIKGFGAATSALFGSVSGISVTNLTIEGYNATAATHIGVLVNELTGSSTFSNITIKDSSVTTTNGAAGGMVGYISGGNSIDLNVNFKNCNLINVTAAGSSAEGKFVGLMCGFDNGETLSFDESCSVDTDCAVADYTSPYSENNDAQWLDDADKTPFDFTKYNGWLGNEENYRAIVNFAGHRLQIKWDGTTKIAPLKSSNNEILIYSPFDLAYIGGMSLTTIRFKSDIDMGGVCENCKNGQGDATTANDNLCTCPDCKKFNPIVSLNNLYGEDHTLYNLYAQAIHSEGELYGAGLIRRTGAGTFENFTFDGAVVKCIDDFSLRDNDQLGGNAYCGTLTSCAVGKMILNNVVAKNGHVIGISKLGGMIGVVRAGIDATDCSVEHYIIENHKIDVENYYEKSITISRLGTFSVSATFYTEGEAGGFIGFMNNAASTITNCHTSHVTMKCYGQDNQTKYITGKLMGFIPVSYPYNIAGRHVNHFIGDIRTTNGESYVINGCTATNNTYAEGYRRDINSQGEGEIIGCCYIVGVAGIAGDTKGSVKVNGKSMEFVGD